MNETALESIAARSQRLKAATHATHDRLDKTIMARDIFASREKFAKFVRVQYRFHRDIDALYGNEALVALIPNLGERRRLLKIATDLSDLRQALPLPVPGKLDNGTSLPTALGWLYVAEGSNLGGTILYKLASQKLGLGSGLGASHLAAHPDGAARHWREFTKVLDSVPLSPAQEGEMVLGAEAAFRAVQGYVREEIG
ncbi:biliverdin-producing heme oxygenase [Pseudoxanthomonas sp. JBR18]|uniref:biliverdin-producing heme oxygenase n=1 Tax=Pseudoxanthomonas sp. JBR18 TaxID=2969308 RepID=UPI0023061B41|nr:biliverdin-producing heme oxygenase [Pseudoxanthomonas sp. JBR18]WCE03597.1 biliverdin-producing heme oxygenase [Pseudoxanthomonas sp. JBR18]